MRSHVNVGHVFLLTFRVFLNDINLIGFFGCRHHHLASRMCLTAPAWNPNTTGGPPQSTKCRVCEDFAKKEVVVM